MFRKMLLIFARDIKVSMRNMMSIFMIFVPVMLAIFVNLLAPGIEDTTVNLVVIEGEHSEMANYLKDYVKIEYVKDQKELESRVMARDNYIGITGQGENTYIITQGNETEEEVKFAQILKTFYEYDRRITDSTSVIKDFGVKTSPIKMLWANMGILFMTMLSGMLISLNIVDEKMDNTVSAMNVTPISRMDWIFGKSMIGILLTLTGSVIMVLIMGVAANINFLQMLVFVLVSSFISIMIGFLQGLNSNDVMTAVASTKMIFFPLAASVIGFEFLAAKWQWTLYWSPYYWIYKGNIDIINGSMTWLNLILYSGIVLLISALVFAYTAPRIRKGLER